MKKFIIPVIIAAVLGVGGGAAAVMINKPWAANADDDDVLYPTNIEVKSGNYYFNGDTQSGMWIEVNPDFLILKGDKVDELMTEAIIDQYNRLYDAPPTEEQLQNQMEEDKLLYCTEKVYLIEKVGTSKTPFTIKVSRDNVNTDMESLKKSNAAFRFNGTDTIHLGLFGDFILVED